MMDYQALAARGFAVAQNLIGPDDCRTLAALWPEQARFRSHVVMQRHGYGQGEYQYFAYPLPDPVERLRRLIDRRQAESMEILRGWLNPEEEQA